MPQSINLNRLINYRKLTMLHIVGYVVIRNPDNKTYYRGFPCAARLHVLGFGRGISRRAKTASIRVENTNA